MIISMLLDAYDVYNLFGCKLLVYQIKCFSINNRYDDSVFASTYDVWFEL